ncbi:MAG: cytochrome c [Alphaproteobacteria bacterium]
MKPRIEKSWQMLMALSAIAIAAFVIVNDHPARAADADQVKRGGALAKTWCSGCHVTGAKSQRSAADIAPTFADIANNKAISDARIRGVLNRPHGRMPTDALTARQIDDVVAYILSLRRTPR